MRAIRTFDAPVQRVYAAWVSPATLVAPVTEVEMDPVVGGRVRVSTGGAPTEDLAGVFVTAEPRRRLTYTWSWGPSAEETMVDVRFHDARERTVVEVHHRGFLDEASRQTHLSGWVAYFDGLATHL